MNKRKTIYRGFNKRRKTKMIKVLLITVSLCLIGGYGYIKVKDSDIIQNLSKKISFLKLDNFFSREGEFLSYDDYKLKNNETDEDVEVQKDPEDKINNEENNKVSEEVKVAVIDSWNIYTIQVASVKDGKDIDKIEAQLVENKIPFSVVEMDGAKKVQTYAFFDKDITRTHMEKIKTVFPDAFISEMKIPVLSLEYTSKYSYVENISKELNKLIKNFKEESEFWSTKEEKRDLKAYNTILTNRKQIISGIQKEADKIDYSKMNVFKDNLIKYTKDVNDKIDMSSKAAKEQNYNISKSLYLSSMQGYFSFINSIKEA
ncbi:hypothetical protein [Romboutsia sp.]|uniref:hypothetical protein n=1 Tax=Romboutsia sp. TaxID=1965302 RepID=UPI002CA9F619|nr:hypothetical protein [Romboutsia sp.]HSQ89220.1 hypothetical protein [Romboutsia sp.]